jgi:hypothetical protein
MLRRITTCGHLTSIVVGEVQLRGRLRWGIGNLVAGGYLLSDTHKRSLFMKCLLLYMNS